MSRTLCALARRLLHRSPYPAQHDAEPPKVAEAGDLALLVLLAAVASVA
jgi:hypothetical protein